MKPNGKPAKKYLKKQIWKLEYAQWAFENAGIAARFLHEEVKDHHGPLYYPLISAVCVLYAKPFTNNNIIGKLPGTFEKFPDEILKRMHRVLWDSRNIFYAHQDPAATVVDPITNKRTPLCEVILHLANESIPLGQAEGIHAEFGLVIIRIEMMPDVIRLCDLQRQRARDEVVRYINLYFEGENPTPGPHWIGVEH